MQNSKFGFKSKSDEKSNNKSQVIDDPFNIPVSESTIKSNNKSQIINNPLPVSNLTKLLSPIPYQNFVDKYIERYGEVCNVISISKIVIFYYNEKSNTVDDTNIVKEITDIAFSDLKYKYVKYEDYPKEIYTRILLYFINKNQTKKLPDMLESEYKLWKEQQKDPDPKDPDEKSDYTMYFILAAVFLLSKN